jgi:hypothetical protein
LDLPKEIPYEPDYTIELFAELPWKGCYGLSYHKARTIAHMVYALNQVCFTLCAVDQTDLGYMVDPNYDILNVMEAGPDYDTLRAAYKIIAFRLLRGKAWVEKKVRIILEPHMSHELSSPASTTISL